MISDKRMFKEIRRLFHLPFPPSTEQAQQVALEEYARVLRDRIDTPEHLVAVVDWLMDHSARCPVPADVIGAAESVKEPARTKAPLGCEKCQGSGYERFTRLHGTIVTDYSKPCDCALGQFIQPEYDKRRNRAPGASQDLG